MLFYCTDAGSTDFGGDFTLDSDEDRLTLYSDGESWVIVENAIAG